jgi:3-oxoacyl-ACP reductase-like protein
VHSRNFSLFKERRPFRKKQHPTTTNANENHRQMFEVHKKIQNVAQKRCCECLPLDSRKIYKNDEKSTHIDLIDKQTTKHNPYCKPSNQKNTMIIAYIVYKLRKVCSGGRRRSSWSSQQTKATTLMSNELNISRLFDVRDKIVVVTGGLTGIGAMLSRGFLLNGASLIVSSRKASQSQANELASSIGASNIIAISADLSTEAGCLQ